METKTKLTNQQAMVLSVLRMGNFTEWEINNRLVISSTGQRVSELRDMGFKIDSVKQPEKKGHLLVLKFCPEGLEGPCDHAPCVELDQGLKTRVIVGDATPRSIGGIEKNTLTFTEKGQGMPCASYVKKPRGYISVVRESTPLPTYSPYRCRECGGKFFRRSDKPGKCFYCGNEKIVMLDAKGREANAVR